MPTAAETSPDFIQYDNKLYRKQVTTSVQITDLTGTTWEFDNYIDVDGLIDLSTISLNFSSNSGSFNIL